MSDYEIGKISISKNNSRIYNGNLYKDDSEITCSPDGINFVEVKLKFSAKLLWVLCKLLFTGKLDIKSRELK